MPPAICDSEDEEEEEPATQRLSTQYSVKSWTSRHSDKAVIQLDGTSNQATGSTAYWRDEIKNAANCLFESNSGQSMMLSTDLDQASTATNSCQTVMKPELQGLTFLRSPKESSKTAGTDSLEFLPTLESKNREDFPALTSKPIMSKLSSFGKSFDLPNATSSPHESPECALQNRFLEHEPAIMFPDSGDTIVDNASWQERMLAEASKDGAPSRRRHADDQITTGSASSGPFRNSSSAKLSGTSNDPPTDKANHVVIQAMKNGVDQYDPAKVKDEGQDAALNMVDGDEKAPMLNSIAAFSRTQLRKTATRRRELSERKLNNDLERRTQDENTDPLNSDDIAVGLPKEQYKPRPSRRRATEFVAGPIGYTVVPETSTRKRRVTMSEAGARTPERSLSTEAVKRRKKVLDLNRAADIENGFVATNEAMMFKSETPGLIPPSVVTISEMQAKDVLASTPGVEADRMLTRLNPLPSPFSKRVKRSHTTIFEDHLGRSQRSLNLSQQQASRRSALKHASNDLAAEAMQLRAMIDDDDDEEDELAKPCPMKDPVPTKRGRGRPAKNRAKDKCETEPVQYDDVSNAEEFPDHDDESEIKEPPKKRGRGRPRKTKTIDRQASESLRDALSDECQEENVAAIPSTDTILAPRTSEAATPRKPSGLEMPTPPSDKSKACLGPQDHSTVSMGVRPPTHSPIQSTTKVRFRVGLSKRQRIQPLHSSIRRK